MARIGRQNLEEVELHYALEFLRRKILRNDYYSGWLHIVDNKDISLTHNRNKVKDVLLTLPF